MLPKTSKSPKIICLIRNKYSDSYLQKRKIDFCDRKKDNEKLTSAVSNFNMLYNENIFKTDYWNFRYELEKITKSLVYDCDFDKVYTSIENFLKNENKIHEKSVIFPIDNDDLCSPKIITLLEDFLKNNDRIVSWNYLRWLNDQSIVYCNQQKTYISLETNHYAFKNNSKYNKIQHIEASKYWNKIKKLKEYKNKDYTIDNKNITSISTLSRFWINHSASKDEILNFALETKKNWKEKDVTDNVHINTFFYNQMKKVYGLYEKLI